MLRRSFKKLRHALTTYLTKSLLKAVTIEEVLVISDSEWLAGQHKLTKGEIVDLKEEAKSFRDSELYRLMKKDLKYGATLQRYDQAKNDDDMLFGKAMLYSFSLIEKYIQNIIKS